MALDGTRNPGLSIRAYFNPAYGAVELYGRTRDGKVVTCDMGMEILPDPGQMIDPMLRIDPETAQELANSLWEAGFRPVGANASVGQAAAMQAHIEDLRMVVKATLPERATPEPRQMTHEELAAIAGRRPS